MKLPKAEQNLPEWQAAGEALIMAAEDRGPLMRAGQEWSGSAPLNGNEITARFDRHE